MKNRNYLILGTLLAIVLGIIFTRLTIENSNIPFVKFSQWSFVFATAYLLILFYIIAFSDFNQVSSVRLTKYKLRWLSDLSIYHGLYIIFGIFVCIWNSDWVGGADWASETENWIFFLGNLQTQVNKMLGLLEATGSVDWVNITPSFRIASLLGLGFLLMAYAFLFSFSFYILSFFVKDSNDVDSITPGKRPYINSFAFLIIMGQLFFFLCGEAFSSGLSILVFFNKYFFLFLFGVLLFYYFQPGASLSMLTKNLFCDYDETTDSIKGQIRAIFRAKRIIMCLCFIAIMFIPTAIFGGLTFHAEDSFGIFKLLSNATLLMFWGFVLILFFTALEGKYNYKLFYQNGSMIEDKMFLPKFVALPTILYFLLVVTLFILFNVLF